VLIFVLVSFFPFLIIFLMTSSKAEINFVRFGWRSEVKPLSNQG